MRDVFKTMLDLFSSYSKHIFHLKELFPVVAIGPTTARTALWFDTVLFENNILQSFAVKYFLITTFNI